MSTATRAARRRAVAVLLLDDPAPEREDERDALVQADTVEPALASLGYICRRVFLSPSIPAAVRQLEQLSPALVFNLVESIGGLGGRLHLAPALIEALGLPCSGAGSVAMAATTDKILAKCILRGAGLDTPDWCLQQPPADGRRWIVKPVDEDASVGIGPENVSSDTAALAALVAERSRAGASRWFYERYVDGREFNVSLLEDTDGLAVLPPAEIRFDAFGPGQPKIVDYAAKWRADSWSYGHTPRVFGSSADDADLLQSISRIARAGASAFGLRGYARVDIRVDSTGRPWVLEVNANPCLSPDAGFMAAAGQAGLDIGRVVERIVRSSAAASTGGLAA